MALSGFKANVIIAINLVTKISSVLNFCVSLAREYYRREARQEALGAIAPVATKTAATATDAVTVAALTLVEPTQHSKPTVQLHLKSSPLSRLLWFLLHLLRLLPRLLRLLPRLNPRRTTPSSRLHRASATRSSQAPLFWTR